jgi:hypothetical protein
VQPGAPDLRSYEPPHLFLIARAEEAAAEDQNQGIPIVETEPLVEGTRLRIAREPARSPAVVRQLEVGECVSHAQVGHRPGSPLGPPSASQSRATAAVQDW